MNHKFGFHCNRTGEDVFDAIVRIKPKVIKTLDPNVDFWRRVRDVHPTAFLIGRQYDEGQQFADNPKGRGQDFAAKILSLEANNVLWNGKKLFDAWESFNEIMPESADAGLKRAYDDFQVAFAERLRSGGQEPIAMNFATGNMLGSDFLNFFRGTLETHRYLGFHEYDWPDLWRLHEQGFNEGNGGMWLTLRYRRTMEDVRRVYGERHTVIITECGMTQGVQGRNDVGWRHESFPIEEQRYWDSLAWYNSELMRDPYVLGSCLFVVGANAQWGSFEHLGGIINRIERLQSSNPSPIVGRPNLPVVVTPDKPIKPEKPKPEPDTQTAVKQSMLLEGAQKQVLHFNPDAALQKRIFADGFVPNSAEFPLKVAGVDYVGQQAENLKSGIVRVYYVKVGDWGNVQFAERPQAAGMAALSTQPPRRRRKSEQEVPKEDKKTKRQEDKKTKREGGKQTR